MQIKKKKKKNKQNISFSFTQKGDITLTVVFVAPDDSDDEDLSNCDAENHLKYKFITNETEHNPRKKPTNSTSSDIESIRRIKDLSASNGNEKKHVLEQADGSDTTSIDSNQRYFN